MSVDTNNTPILEQIERFPQGLTEESVKQIRDSVELSLHAGNLASQKAEVEKVCVNSVIKEEQTFSRNDIEKLIALFAMTNKLDMDNLKVSKIITNEQGTLLVLEVKSPNPDGGYKLINYTIKGRHDKMKSTTTSLDMSSWDKDDMFERADIIAEYLEGKWHFTS